MTFEQVLMECAGNKALVAEFDRLSGYNLSLKGTPVDLMIDDATGRTKEGVGEFATFIYAAVWKPLAEKSA